MSFRVIQGGKSGIQISKFSVYKAVRDLPDCGVTITRKGKPVARLVPAVEGLELGPHGQAHLERLQALLEARGKYSEAAKVLAEEAAQVYDLVQSLRDEMRGAGSLAAAAVGLQKTGLIDGEGLPVAQTITSGLHMAHMDALSKLQTLYRDLGLHKMLDDQGEAGAREKRKPSWRDGM